MLFKKRLFEELIAPLYFMLELSSEAYQKYLSNRIYLHAETLRFSNKKIEKLITRKAALIPAEMKPAFIELITHYHSWFIQFKLHKTKMNPAPGDTFIFDQANNQVSFPRKAEEQINEFYLKLKHELASEIQLEDLPV